MVAVGAAAASSDALAVTAVTAATAATATTAATAAISGLSAIASLPAIAPSAGLPPLQATPTTGGPLAILGTVLLSWAFFSFTAQVAATFFLGDVPWRRAGIVGAVPALTVTALISYPPAVILPVALGADLVAIQMVYRVRYRTAALVTAMHGVAAISLGVPLAYLLELLGTAPV